MQNNTPLLTLTIVATAALTAQRFVTAAGAQTGAGGNAIGVARYSGAIGDKVPCDVLGTTYVEAGAAIAAGALVASDASGRAITWASGVALGRVVPSDPGATAAGQFVEILQIPN
jgi:hypothetical protein